MFNKLSFFSIIFLFLTFLNSNLLAEPTHIAAFNITSEEPVPTGVTFNPDGTRMYVTGINTDRIRQYTLSTGFDLSSTVTLERSRNITSLENRPQDIAFNSDGTVIFTAGSEGDGIDSWSLSTAYDINSMDPTNDHIAFTSVGGDPRDLEFNSDGTKMFILNGSTEVKEYALSAAYNPANPTLTNTLTISLDGGFGQGMGFSSDGKKMFLVANTTNVIHFYNLTSGFDLSDVSYFGKYSVSTSASMNITGLAFNSDGTKMFHADFNEDEIQEYSLPCSYGVVECEPTLSSSSPADGATGVGVNDNIVLTFSEAVDAESGNIVIKKSSDDSVFETIDVSGSNVTGTGTTEISVNVSTTCDIDTSYYITIDSTAFDDSSSLSYAGINDSTTFNFSTGQVNPLLDDKNLVGSIEAQVEMSHRIIKHTTTTVMHRIEWLRRYKNEDNLTNQNIKFQFSDPMLSSLSKAIPISYNQDVIVESLPNNWFLWSEGDISVGKIGEDLSSSRKKIQTNGITIGADNRVNQDRMYGVALGFRKDDVDVGSLGTGIDTEAYSLSLYGTLSSNDTNFLDGILGMSTLKSDLIRKKNSNTLTGERSGKQVFSSINFSKVFNEGNINFNPTGRIDIGYTELGGYNETGKNALSYDKQKIQTGITSIGMMLDNTKQIKRGMMLKQISRLEYSADFSPNSDATLSYVADPATDYTLTVGNEARDNFRGGIGFDFSTDDGFSAIVNYERYQSKGSHHTDTMYFTLGWISNRRTEYALTFNGTDKIATSFDIIKNINGFNLKLGLDHYLLTETSNQKAILYISRKF